MQIIAENRNAERRYHIESRLEAGLILKGSEVKALRSGRVDLNRSYGVAQSGGLYLINAHIGHYVFAAGSGHAPRRARRLLLHRRQELKLAQEIKQGGVTLIPLRLYFNQAGFAKVELGIARGKKQYDRRREIKQKEWRRRKEKLMRSKSK